MLTKKVGVDLGTSNVLVYVRGRGIVVNEPSVVALAVRDNTVVAVGAEARAMLGRAPESIEVVRPIRDGVIADYLLTEAMLRHLIRKVVGRFKLIKPEVMICIPAGVTSVEQRAVRDAAEQAGARHPAQLVAEPLAAAIGARIPIGSPKGHMVLNIGGGRTEAAIISMYGIVASESVRMAGDHMDEAIAAYVKRKHNLLIGDRTAEEVKIAIGGALPIETDLACTVRGRDVVTGMPKTVTVTSVEVTQALSDILTGIVQTVRAVLQRTPPELATDVMDGGVVLTGGGALLRHIDTLVTRELGVPCFVAENPLQCVAVGAGVALEFLDVIKRSQPPDEEALVGIHPV